METTSSKTPISFYYLVPRFHFPNRVKLKNFLARIFKLEKARFNALTCVFCSDDYLLEINKSYLSHEYYTDIITFNLAEDQSITGELYISIDRVRENALELGVPFRQELHRVMFHGVLHLCGYQDASKAEKEAMRAAEDKYLELYGLT